jgi:hypothetical protein
MVEYCRESLDDEEVDIVYSSLKSASKRRQDGMCYTFDVAMCDRIFDYLL